MSSLRQFFKQETAGGIVMLLAAALALLLANSALGDAYRALTGASLTPSFTVSSVVKDVLMPFFFLLVGMELKKEMRIGFLSQPGQKLLPLAAALGGIILPAILYLTITAKTPELAAGWAIPTATDIAFALCVLKLAGQRVPQSAKVFLLAIAIYDDLAAILIVAVFYSEGIALLPLLAAGGVTALMGLLNRAEHPAAWLYVALGVVLGLCLHEAHVHTTVAGVITGGMVPLKVGVKKPLENFMHTLHPPVVFGILPVFAFVSAGVAFTNFTVTDLFSPLPLGIALALFIGKQCGILGATYVAVRLGLAPEPKGASWPMLYGIAVIAGIGFTMSLFVGALAFTDSVHYDEVKIGVMAGSLLAALWGLLVIRFVTRAKG